MTRSVNIEVYCDQTPDRGAEVFAVVSEHRSDLPKPFDERVQQWAKEHFHGLSVGDGVPNAGTMIYEPHGEIVNIELDTTTTSNRD